MIVVLADDFSGAAEIGGVALRYGLHAEIQMEPAVRSNADVLVIDTNTRSLKEEDAVSKIIQVAATLQQLPGSFRLFKKVDSVMRGHIVPEINALQQQLGYNRALLLPANPGRGRKIIGGHYNINGIRLNKTAFADDPDFPISSSSIEELVMPETFHLRYCHIQQGSDLPDLSFITADVETRADLKSYMSNIREKDLCCGAAECFETWLENLGYIERAGKSIVTNDSSRSPFTFIINGSTIKNDEERELFKKLGIPLISVPGRWQENHFILNKDEEIVFQQKILDSLNTYRTVVTTIDHPVKQIRDQADFFPGCFVRLIHYISDTIGMNNIHFCLTGGATSFAIINSIGIRDLRVVEEVAPGIVTLRSCGIAKVFFTVKPGSYPWPGPFLESLSKQSTRN